MKETEERPNKTVIQSYVHFRESAWFVSTIERTYDTFQGESRGLETLVWIWNPETKERGKIVYQAGGINDHFNICRGLLKDGELPDNDY